MRRLIPQQIASANSTRRTAQDAGHERAAFFELAGCRHRISTRQIARLAKPACTLYGRSRPMPSECAEFKVLLETQ